MREGNKIIIIESFVSISREHILSKLKVSLWQIEATLALYLPSQRNRTDLGNGLLYTELDDRHVTGLSQSEYTISAEVATVT